MSSLETIGDGVPNRCFSGFTSAGIEIGVPNHPVRTKQTFDSQAALKTMENLRYELQIQRADTTSMTPELAYHTSGNSTTSASLQQVKQPSRNPFNDSMVERESPMTVEFPKLASYASEMSRPDPSPKTQPQGPVDLFKIMQILSNPPSPDPTAQTVGLYLNQFDFIFFDRILLVQNPPEPNDSIPYFLNTLETTVRNMEDAGLSLQTYMIQQQLVAGIPPHQVQAMFSTTSSNANTNPNHQPCREIIVDANEPNLSIHHPGPADRPKYEGIPPPFADHVLAAILPGSSVNAQMERVRVVRFYQEFFRDFSGIGTRVLVDGGAGLEEGVVEPFNEEVDLFEDCNGFQGVDGVENLDGTGDFSEVDGHNDMEDFNGVEDLNRSDNFNGTERNCDVEMGDIDASDDLESLFEDDGMDSG